LRGGPGLGGVIGAAALIAVGERVVAVGAQRHTIVAGMARTARVGNLLGRQPAFGSLVLALRRTVLIWVGVAPGPIQRPLAGPRPFGGSRRSLLLLVSAADLADNQLLRMPVGKGGHRQIGHVGVDTRAPARGDLGATR